MHTSSLEPVAHKPATLTLWRNALIAVVTVVWLGLEAASAAPATSLARSIDVDAPPAAVWALIGPFCGIKDWHPVIATCTDDGRTLPSSYARLPFS